MGKHNSSQNPHVSRGPQFHDWIICELSQMFGRTFRILKEWLFYFLFCLYGYLIY
jgi:hypothetical protein